MWPCNAEFATNMSYAVILSQGFSYGNYEEAIAKNELATVLKLDPQIGCFGAIPTMARIGQFVHPSYAGTVPTLTVPTPSLEPTATDEPPTPTIQSTATNEPSTPTHSADCHSTPRRPGPQLYPFPQPHPDLLSNRESFFQGTIIFGGLILLAMGFGAGWFIRHGK